MIDYLAIFAYIACDWLRERSLHFLAQRDIMPVWNIDGAERYNAVFKTKKTVFARKDRP